MFLLKSVLLLTNATLISGILNNLALGKPTKSSTLASNKDRAVDGNRESRFFQNSCWECQVGDMQPYWMVDLQGDFILEYITITNRGDCCGERMHALKIEVFADDPVQNPLIPSQLCAMYDGPMAAGATENISCSCAAQGRYVRIQGLDRQSENDRLTLCEVEVYERTQTGYFYVTFFDSSLSRECVHHERLRSSHGNFSISKKGRENIPIPSTNECYFSAWWEPDMSEMLSQFMSQLQLSAAPTAATTEAASVSTTTTTPMAVSCFNTKLQRLVGTRYVGNVVPVDVTSAVECSTYCSYNRSCIGFNYNYNTHGCELRVGSANASSAHDWFYFFQRLCR